MSILILLVISITFLINFFISIPSQLIQFTYIPKTLHAIASMPILINSIEKNLGKFPSFLIYAILEWIMIILLFTKGILAFISNEFAKFFELSIPCLLCTRIDHVLVHRNSNFYYNDSMCEVHKKDISSLAYCHVHKKLSDIRSMCEGCLLSFAIEKDSDIDKYDSLAGILHKDVDGIVEDDRKLLMKPLKKDDIDLLEDKSGTQSCSCCGEPLKLRSSGKYKRSLSMNVPAPSPSPRAPLFGTKREEGSHIRYTELKFMSNAKSDILGDEAISKGDNQGNKEDIKATMVPLQIDNDDINGDVSRTPSFARGNRFFGIPLSDSAQASPRWGNRGNKKISTDKLDFNIDLDDTSEADSDAMTRLKKQVHLDRKSLMELYMELDEERSAAAVAANNAMAMITRLQAEKAAVQMEALQYQRMMEEQAEYDQEAIQVMKDMLLKREDVKALESELEIYRERYGRIKNMGSEICEVDAEDDYQDIKSQSMTSFSERSDGDSSNEENERLTGEIGGRKSEGSLLDFDREKSFLLSLLTNLEKQIHLPIEERLSSLDGTIKNEDAGRGNENKAALTREVSLFRERLRAIEADSGFLKHAAMTLQRGVEGTKLLTEIAQNLRKLRQTVSSPTDESDA